jgi:hypothetical protein
VTLHSDRRAEELLNIYRKLSRKSKQIARQMLLLEYSRRAQGCPVLPTMANYSLFFYSGVFMLCLFPILPDHLLALPIAVGGGVSLAIIREMTSNLVVLAKGNLQHVRRNINRY